MQNTHYDEQRVREVVKQIVLNGHPSLKRACEFLHLPEDFLPADPRKYSVVTATQLRLVALYLLQNNLVAQSTKPRTRSVPQPISNHLESKKRELANVLKVQQNLTALQQQQEARVRAVTDRALYKDQRRDEKLRQLQEERRVVYAMREQKLQGVLNKKLVEENRREQQALTQPNKGIPLNRSLPKLRQATSRRTFLDDDEDVELKLQRIQEKLDGSAERRNQFLVSKSYRGTSHYSPRKPEEEEGLLRKVLKLQNKVEQSSERREKLRLASQIARTASSRVIRRPKPPRVTNDQKIQHVRSLVKTRQGLAVRELTEKHSSRTKHVEHNLQVRKQVEQLEKYRILQQVVEREQRLRERQEAEAQLRSSLQEYELQLQHSQPN